MSYDTHKFKKQNKKTRDEYVAQTAAIDEEQQKQVREPKSKEKEQEEKQQPIERVEQLPTRQEDEKPLFDANKALHVLADLRSDIELRETIGLHLNSQPWQSIEAARAELTQPREESEQRDEDRSDIRTEKKQDEPGGRFTEAENARAEIDLDALEEFIRGCDPPIENILENVESHKLAWQAICEVDYDVEEHPADIQREIEDQSREEELTASSAHPVVVAYHERNEKRELNDQFLTRQLFN